MAKAVLKENKIKKSKTEKIIFGVVFALFFVYSLALLYPLFFTFTASLIKNGRIYERNPMAISIPPYFSNYLKAIEELEIRSTGFVGMFLNSVWWAFGADFLGILSSSMISYLRDDREYGFTIAKNVLESFSFANARKCYIEVYNACEKARKITLTVSDGENIATRETEIPVGVWTKVSVNNLLSLDLTKINEVTVTLNAYDHFEAGALYFKNLSVEVGK